MKAGHVYTMANAAVRLQFLAMERSLRAVGCDLPLRVIPYPGETFDLPPNATWWRTPLQDWIDAQGAHPMVRKAQCLTVANYFYTDIDVIFLRHPAEALAPHAGFVAADTEWNKPEWAFTPASAAVLARRTSVWQRNLFNCGFFACDRVLYTAEEYQKIAASDPAYHDILFKACHDQPGLNLLVALSDAPFTNLTLPPHNLESTWVGDYPGAYEALWRDPATKPFFLHWAGEGLDTDRPVNALFYQYLSADERREWDRAQAEKKARRDAAGRWPLGLRVMGAIIRARYPRYHIQYRTH